MESPATGELSMLKLEQMEGRRASGAGQTRGGGRARDLSLASADPSQGAGGRSSLNLNGERCCTLGPAAHGKRIFQPLFLIAARAARSPRGNATT